MTGSDLQLDCCDLLAAAHNSCCNSHSFGFDFVERAAVALQRRFLASKLLPPQNGHVYVPRVDVDSVADALSELGRHYGCARAEEWVIDHIAALRMVHNRPPH